MQLNQLSTHTHGYAILLNVVPCCLPSCFSCISECLQFWFWSQFWSLLSNQVCIPDKQWGKVNQYIGVWGRERFIAEPYKEDRWLMIPQILNSPKCFSKTFLRARWGEGVVGCYKCLGVGILCSLFYSCSCRSVTIFLQTSSKINVLPLFISIWMEKCYRYNT